jgi:hypothetical protein
MHKNEVIASVLLGACVMAVTFGGCPGGAEQNNCECPAGTQREFSDNPACCDGEDCACTVKTTHDLTLGARPVTFNVPEGGLAQADYVGEDEFEITKTFLLSAEYINFLSAMAGFCFPNLYRQDTGNKVRRFFYDLEVCPCRRIGLALSLFPVAERIQRKPEAVCEGRLGKPHPLSYRLYIYRFRYVHLVGALRQFPSRNSNRLFHTFNYPAPTHFYLPPAW